jgi:hypothetical protein
MARAADFGQIAGPCSSGAMVGKFAATVDAPTLALGLGAESK